MKDIGLWKYLNRRDPRPLLQPGYHRAAQRPPTPEERSLIARRLARTPEGAASLLEEYGTVQNVLRHVKPPKRKRPPRGRRALAILRRMWP